MSVCFLTLRRALVALLLAGAALVLTPTAGQAACSCTGGGVQKLADQVDAVFSAVIIDSSVDSIGTAKGSRGVRRYDVQVDRIYQGTVKEPTVQVVSPAQTSACGFGRISAGQPWIFFVNGADVTYFGNTCLGSARATADFQRRVERVLGAGRVLVEPVPEAPPLEYSDRDVSDPPPLGRLIAPGAAAALVGLLGLAFVRRRATR